MLKEIDPRSGEFYCPICCFANKTEYEFEMPAPKGHRVKLDVLTQLLADGNALQVQTDELYILRQAMELALAWQQMACTALHPDISTAELLELLAQTKGLIVICPEITTVQAHLLVRKIQTVLEAGYEQRYPAYEEVEP